MLRVLFCFLIFGSSSVYAGFSGTYSGTGSATDSNGWDAECTKVQVEISEAPSAVTFTKIDYACGAISQHRASFVLVRQGEKLLLNGKAVGTISAEEIDAAVPWPGIDNLQFVIRMRLANGQLDFLEDWLSTEESSIDLVFSLKAHLAPASK